MVSTFMDTVAQRAAVPAADIAAFQRAWAALDQTRSGYLARWKVGSRPLSALSLLSLFLSLSPYLSLILSLSLSP
jgi:hypothetical protein